jgi:hypothetical protein
MPIFFLESSMSENNDKVVFLAFDNENIADQAVPVHSCSYCHNKTFITRPMKGAGGSMECAVCHTHIGFFGWMDDPIDGEEDPVA